MTVCESTECGHEATHLVKYKGVELRLCGACALQMVQAVQKARRKEAKRQFWKKVLITPVYPFIWVES